MISGKAGEAVRVSDRCRILLLWPLERDPTTDDENVNSLIFRVEINGYSVLVTGDLTEEGEQAMLEEYRGTSMLDCDVLKVAHHGSRYSSTTEFLEAVSPKIAVISVGRNTYGHPTPEAIRRLKACGAKVYRTDRMGAVGIVTGKRGLRVVTGRVHHIAHS
jgi:competence protein ComEC